MPKNDKPDLPKNDKPELKSPNISNQSVRPTMQFSPNQSNLVSNTNLASRPSLSEQGGQSQANNNMFAGT